MIVQKDFLNKLKDFGLNSYEAKLWTALLSRGISTAGELSDISNVPRSRSYDVLESLEKKGFIIMKIGKPIKYIAVPPIEVIERVKQKIRRVAEEKTKILESARKDEVLKELTLLHNQGIELVEPSDLAGSFRGRDSLYNQLDSMIKNASKSVIVMTSEEGLLRKGKKLGKALKKAKEKKVDVRIVAPITKKTEKTAKELGRFATIRHANNDARFVVVDGKEVLFMLMDDRKVHEAYDSGVWVKADLFASTLKNFFDGMWGKFKPSG